jgi:hypothetical protein
MQIKSTQKTEDPTLKNSYNSFQGTLCHQNSCSNDSKGSSQLNWSTQNRNLRQRSKQMKLQVPCKHVTVKSSSKTNSTKPITNRFKQNKQRSHWPARSTGLKKTHKFPTLSFHPQISNRNQQCNTHTKGKTCLSCNSRSLRNQSKTITYKQ